MNRVNKVGDWRELVTLTEGDLREKEGSGPAVKVTFARYGREVRYSHTPGRVEDGQFRPVQYLHHRNVSSYMLLLNYTFVAVKVAQEMDPDVVALHPFLLKDVLRRVMKDEEEKEKQSVPQQEKLKVAQHKKREKPRPVNKPTLGVSIGEMLKAKQRKQ